jgi:hypothetical protein
MNICNLGHQPWIRKVCSDSKGVGLVSPRSGPQETQRLLNADLDKWGAIIKTIGLKPE